MDNNFWKKLPKPFFCLAPMMDITDSPFRQMVAECGKPDVFYTWFISVDGLCSAGKDNILRQPNLVIAEKERPIVVQLFGKDPEKFEESARIFSELGFDGIDVNMGCPHKDVLKIGAGAELIKNPKLAGEIIRATKKGAGRIPVSVKTRIGFYKSGEMESWISALLEEKPAAICVHGRTAKHKFGGLADWKKIGEAVEMAKGTGTIIIGNGDVKNREEGIIKAEESGADGIMIGRSILGNPWIFSKQNLNIFPCQKEKRLKMLVKHAVLFEKYYKDKKSFGNFRKYLRSYVSGFDGSKELRMKLMEAKSAKDISEIAKL